MTQNEKIALVSIRGEIGSLAMDLHDYCRCYDIPKESELSTLTEEATKITEKINKLLLKKK